MIDYTNSERALIGALFLMADEKPISEMFRHVTQLEPADIQCQTCSTIYLHIKKSVMAEQSFDMITIYEEIDKAKHAGKKILFTDLGVLIKEQSSYAAIESHIKTIKNASLQRKSLQVLTSLYESIQSSDNIIQSLGNAESAIESLMQKAHGESSGMVHVGQLISDWVARADDEYQGKETEKGVTFGFNGVDEMLGDDLLKPGSLVVIGANPGKGKTAVMVTSSIEMARQYPDRTVQVYSLEMPSAQIADRMMGSAVQNKKPKHYQDTDWGKIGSHIEQLNSTNLYVCDNPVLTVEQIKMNARDVIAQGGRISAIFVDYLTLMKLPKADRHDLSVGEVTKQCKRLAKEIGCVVVLLAQLSRSNMQRANKRPINSDLRDSGQIENDADYIFFPYYDYLFNPDSECGPYAEMICGKNRHGKAETTFAKVINGVWMSCDQKDAQLKIGGSN